VVISSTSLEILKNQYNIQIPEKFSLQSKESYELLLSFSLIRNTRSLFTANKRFEALDTIRLLLIINVHIAHIYAFTASLGLLTIKKTITEITPKILNDNRYVFARNSIIIDALFTIRFVSIKFNKIENIFVNWFNFFLQRFYYVLRIIEKIRQNKGWFQLFPIFTSSMDQILCAIIGLNTVLLFIPTLRRRTRLEFWAQMGYTRVWKRNCFVKKISLYWQFWWNRRTDFKCE